MAKELSATQLREPSSEEHILITESSRQEETAQRHKGCLTSRKKTVKLNYKVKRTYSIRKIKSTGAILILVWNFLLANLLAYICYYMYHEKAHFIGWCVALPLAGWLADVYFGRYKVIYWSIWCMWVASILATVSSVVAQSVESYSAVNDKVMMVFVALMIFGFGGYQANIVQFGIDQLHDASTDEIKAFITWFVWSFFTGGIFIQYIVLCMKEQYKIFGLVLVCICITLVLCSLAVMNNILIKEPVTENAYKLVYNVIKYAIKNKHPRCRSAFTYCEDELPSRMDFGKSKYGGPFTTEQVEDVKTFIQLQIVIWFGYTMISGIFVVTPLYNKLIIVLSPRGQLLTPTPECYTISLYTELFFYSAGLVIPLNEFIIRPLLHRHFNFVQSYWKFIIGTVLQLIRVILLGTFTTLARHNYLQHSYGNATTLQCLFHVDDGALASSFDYRWMALLSFINSISLLIFGIGGIEFLCAQTPYSMRGLVSGVIYGSIALFAGTGFLVTYPFTIDLPKWNTGLIGCGFWYLLLSALYLIFNCFILCIFRKLYKNRKRQDVLPNEQIFAERYYGTQ